MSLNWDISKIADKETVCWMVADCDQPMRGIKAGDRVQDNKTWCLIMYSMVCGYREITENNVQDVWTRLAYYQSLFGPLLGDGEISQWISRADVHKHIGLHTNANTETMAAWTKRMAKQFTDELAGKIATRPAAQRECDRARTMTRAVNKLDTLFTPGESDPDVMANMLIAAAQIIGYAKEKANG